MATKARIIADIVSDLANNQSKAIVVNSSGNDLVYGVAGGEISEPTDAYKNFNTVSANQTLTMAADKNYFLQGPITVNNNVTWTVNGTGTLIIM